jgi:hypothetical protein
LQPQKRYRVTFIDEARKQEKTTMSGRELMTNFELRVPQRGASLLLRYQPE